MVLTCFDHPHVTRKILFSWVLGGMNIPSTSREPGRFKAYIWMPPWTSHPSWKWLLWVCGKLHITLGFKRLTAHRARNALLPPRNGPPGLGGWLSWAQVLYYPDSWHKKYHFGLSNPQLLGKSPWLNAYSYPEHPKYHGKTCAKTVITITLQ
jgi:hypothetical protein